MFDRIKKIVVVVFLALLIWAFAYLALEKSVKRVGTLDISSSSPELLVNFDRQTPVTLSLGVSGQTSKVAEFNKSYGLPGNNPQKERLDFYYNPVKYGHVESGTYNLSVMQLIQDSDKLKYLGLMLDSCNIETLEVTVERLVEKHLPVQCTAADGSILKHDTIDPAFVTMYVRQDYDIPAVVTLTDQEIIKARTTSVKARPYITIDNKDIQSEQMVTITLPSTQNPLKERPFQPSRIGFILSSELQGIYTVQILNEDQLRGITPLMATDQAFEAYKKMPFHLLLEIKEEDINNTSEAGIPRPVIYNFPHEYLCSNEIGLKEEPREAKFKLVPIKQN